MALGGTVPYAGLHHDPADFQVDNAVCGGSQVKNPDYSVVISSSSEQLAKVLVH